MRYRRDTTLGATYFFTVVTYQRRPLFQTDEAVELLRESILTVRQRHPFIIDAFVLLPDHLHCIWTLPPDDADYATRWMLIKSRFTRHLGNVGLGQMEGVGLRGAQPDLRVVAGASRNAAFVREDRRQRTVWQPRYWEHRIRDDTDFARHVDYIHWNPVKHGLVARVADWPYSSVHRYLRQGLLPANWAGVGIEDADGKLFGE